MKNLADYSQYKCPYSHIEKECGHELHGPEGYEDIYGIWCPCGFRAPVFYLDPSELGLELKVKETIAKSTIITDDISSLLSDIEFWKKSMIPNNDILRYIIERLDQIMLKFS